MTAKLAQAGMTDPLVTLLRAARDARYTLMSRKEYGASGEHLLDHAAEKLTKALENYPIPRRTEWVNVPGEKMYADLDEWSSQ